MTVAPMNRLLDATSRTLGHGPFRRRLWAILAPMLVATATIGGCGSVRDGDTAGQGATSSSSAATGSSPQVVPADPNSYRADSGGVEGYYFTSPSGLWRCAIIPGGHNPQAGCQPSTNTRPDMGVAGAPTVEDQFTHGQAQPNAILVDRSSGPRFDHLGQAIFWLTPGEAQILPYNTPLTAGGFTCNTQETGVSCRDDQSGRGFTFSTAGFSMRYSEVEARAGTFSPPASQVPPPAGGTNCVASDYRYENIHGSTPCDFMIEVWSRYRADAPAGGAYTVEGLAGGSIAFCSDAPDVPGSAGTCGYGGWGFRALGQPGRPEASASDRAGALDFRKASCTLQFVLDANGVCHLGQ
ncbi:hypothetical protein NOVA_14345 [Nocardia nova]|uniref:hypothetical protein n=1 Tax=Nocardia nova TaxID=37330 RepID=UPI001C472587|nr:hypothetical protein [Nocardia nova]MBV7703957.1 hypothetical protein [Nocardia nova]